MAPRRQRLRTVLGAAVAVGSGLACTYDWPVPVRPIDGGPPSDAGSLGPPPDAPPPADGGARCPGDGGPTAIRIEEGNTTFCVDATEVTRAQYATFLATGPKNTHPRCGSNRSFTPARDWPYDARTAEHPVVGVDWCDAHAFCQWSGKHLCGAVEGGPIAKALSAVPLRSRLPYACSRGGRQAYAYGTTYDRAACAVDAAEAGVAPVGSSPRCEGGYAGIFDLVGNVSEWIDSCDETTADGGAERCRVFNSSVYEREPDELTCTHVREELRAEAATSIGFRCCSP